MPSATTPLAARPGRRRRGSPESEDLSSADNRTPRGRRIRREAPSRNAPGGACRRNRRVDRVGARPRDGGRGPAPDRLALADGDRDPVRDRRRQAGDRRRRPVGLPEVGAEDEPVRLHPERRGGRRPTTPTSSSSRTRRRTSRERSPRRTSACSCRSRANTFKDAYAQMTQLGRVTGHLRGGDGARVAHEGADREARQGGAARRRCPSTTSSAPTTTRPRRRRSSARSSSSSA